MSARVRLEVIARPGAAPDAVLCGPGSLAANTAVRLAAGRLVFDAELTERWRRLVVCTREFSAAWRVSAEQPRGFLLEVLS